MNKTVWWLIYVVMIVVVGSGWWLHEPARDKRRVVQAQPTAVLPAVPTAPGAAIAVQPVALSSGQTADQQTTHTFLIQNSGGVPLTWTLTADQRGAVILGAGSAAPAAAGRRQLLTPLADAVTAATSPGSETAVLSGVPVQARAAALRTGADLISLHLDDAGAETALGVDGQLFWLNRFTPAPDEYPFYLEEVRIAFFDGTGVNVGDELELYIYEDQDSDGDPATGATLAGSFAGTVDHLTGWNVYALPLPLLLTGPGDVLLGVKGVTTGTGPQEWPAFLDMTISQGRSYWGPATITAPPTLYGLVDATGNPGNWLLRGIGSQDPLCQTPQSVPWLQLATDSGVVAPGAETAVAVTFDATGLSVGTYTATLCLDNSDPTRPRVQIPVTLTVCDRPLTVTDLALDDAAGNTRLIWTGDADSYEVWWGVADPYFTPDATCEAADNCALVAASPFIHPGGMGDSGANYTYDVTAVAVCGPDTIAAPMSPRQAEFDFALQPGD